MYDAALLTRCYTQYVLRQFIDSEAKFNKIHFINKGIDFIDLLSIFKDRRHDLIYTYCGYLFPKLFVISITSPLETQYLISINLFLILTFMLILLSHEIVQILNLCIQQLAMLSLAMVT